MRFVSFFLSILLSGTILATDFRQAAAQDAGDLLGQFLFGAARQGQNLRLRRNQEEFLIKRLQVALHSLGYYSGSIDGSFGAGTQSALNSYLQATGRRARRQISESDIEQIEMEARNSPSQNNMEGEVEEEAPPLTYSPAADQSRWLRKDLDMVSSPRPIVLKAPDKALWLVVASAKTLDEVGPVAKLYAEDFPGTIIVRSVNGVYAILLGWLPADEARNISGVLKDQSIIPSDSFLSGGERFLSPIWATGHKSIKVRRDLLRFALFRANSHVWARAMQNNSHLADFNARVAGLNQEDGTFNFLSLRKTPSTSAEEISRMPEGMVLQILESRDGWHRVRLLSGSEGWASGRYVAFNDAVLSGSVGALAEGDDESGDNASADFDQALQDQLMAKGNSLVSDVDVFLKTNADVKNIGELAELVGTLRTAMVDLDFAKIEVATTTLDRLLGQLPEFQAFAAARQSERLSAEQKALVENRNKADKNVFFLKKYIARNITSPDVPKLASLLKEFEVLSADASLAEVSALNKRLDDAIVEDSISTEYSKILTDYIKPTAVNDITATDKTADLTRPGSSDEMQVSNRSQNEIVDRTALEAAKKSAAELLDKLNAYSASGKRMARSLEVARLIVSLKASIRQNDPVGTTRDEKALRTLVAQDQDFAAFLMADNEARQIAAAKALDAARSEVRRINGFLTDYMTSNFTSDKLEQIVPLQTETEAALGSADADVLLTVAKRTSERLAALGLTEEFDAYKLPDVTAAKRAGKVLMAEAEQNTLHMKARDLLERLKRFDALERPLADPMRVVRAASALRNALKDTSAMDVGKAIADLEQSLSADNAWNNFVKEEELAQASTSRDTQAAAMSEGLRLTAFITRRVTKNVTAEGVDALLGAQDRLGAAMLSKQTGELLAAVKLATQAINQLGLAADLSSFTLQTADATAKATELKETENEIIVSEANRLVLSGPDGDLLALFNATGKATHVSRTLTGSVAFTEGASVCWFHPMPTDSLQTRMIYGSLKKAGATALSVVGTCESNSLASYDVVLLRRGDFVKTERSYAKPLVEAFEKQDFVQLLKISDVDIKAAEATSLNSRTKLSADLDKGVRNGFGAVVFDNQSGQLCRSDADNRAAHDQILGDLTESLTGELAFAKTSTHVDAQSAYREIQAGHCQVLYAEAKLLGDVLKAARRDGIAATLSPTFFETKDVAVIAAKIADDEARQKQEEQKRQTELANKATEERTRQNEETLRKARETEELRQQNTSKAMGLLAELTELSKEWISQPAPESNHELALLYPGFKTWFINKKMAGWELDGLGYKSELVDYGSARWQDRRIEAAVIDLTISLKNRALGKYETSCYRLSFLDDKEFHMWREPSMALCSEPTSTTAWKTSHDFQSLWKK